MSTKCGRARSKVAAPITVPQRNWRFLSSTKKFISRVVGIPSCAACAPLLVMLITPRLS